MSRRTLLGLAAGAAAAPFLSGCGTGSGSGAGGEPDVTIWYAFSSPQEQDWLLKNVVAPFEKT
jgi:ABC-type glycerol-3-phosphate transport system substrate-binding protein